MIISQANLFLIFIIIGFIISLLFDFFRILRRSFKTSDLVTYIEDIIFWIATGLIVLYSIFIFNNGEIRLFMFLGILIGISIYMLCLSNSIIKFSVMCIKFLKKIIIYPFNLCIKILRKIFLKPISFIFINIRKIFIKIKKTTINYINFTKKVRNNKNMEKKRDFKDKRRII